MTRFDQPAEGELSPRVRPATADDLPRCLELINRTHAGLDLFRPYTLSYLEQRLDDPSWGPKPSFYPAVYGWPDFRVVEVDGQVVACGGLWDRGRDVRELWRRPSGPSGPEVVQVDDPAALMAYGYAEGQETALVELIRHFLATSWAGAESLPPSNSHPQRGKQRPTR